MSKLKEKAKFNLDAAELLQKKNLFAPSVHCSYYSCFQLMKFTIKDFFGISYEQLRIKIQTTNQKVHSYIIGFIGNQIMDNNRSEYALFHRKIKDLKEFREMSDYENVEVDIDQSQKALDAAKYLRIQMNKIFHV